MPRATTGRENATLVQLSGNSADAGDCFGPQVIRISPRLVGTIHLDFLTQVARFSGESSGDTTRAAAALARLLRSGERGLFGRMGRSMRLILI